MTRLSTLGKSCHELRKKGIEKRIERREGRNNTRISTAERINYIDNKILHSIHQISELHRHIQHVLDSYKHLSSYYNSIHNRNTQRYQHSGELYNYSQKPPAPFTPPQYVKAVLNPNLNSLGYS